MALVIMYAINARVCYSGLMMQGLKVIKARVWFYISRPILYV